MNSWYQRKRGRTNLVGGFKGEIIGKYHRYIPYIPHSWLVVSNMAFIFHFIYGMSSFPLTFIFFRGVGQPPTRYIYIYPIYNQHVKPLSCYTYHDYMHIQYLPCNKHYYLPCNNHITTTNQDTINHH